MSLENSLKQFSSTLVHRTFYYEKINDFDEKYSLQPAKIAIIIYF